MTVPPPHPTLWSVSSPTILCSCYGRIILVEEILKADWYFYWRSGHQVGSARFGPQNRREELAVSPPVQFQPDRKGKGSMVAVRADDPEGSVR